MTKQRNLYSEYSCSRREGLTVNAEIVQNDCKNLVHLGDTQNVYSMVNSNISGAKARPFLLYYQDGKNIAMEGSINQYSERLEKVAIEKAKQQALAVRWNMSTVLLGFAILAAVIVLRSESVATEIVAPMAIIGLAIIWLTGYIRGRKLFQRLYDQEIQDLRILRKEDNNEAIVQTPLSPREMEVLSYIAAGYINKEIAIALGLSEQTIKNQVTSIMQKLDVHDRTHAVVLSIQNGWISPDEIFNRDVTKLNEKSVTKDSSISSTGVLTH